MKLIGFVCALALAGAVGGCGEDEANGTGGTGGTGATGGTGGTGGAGGAGGAGGGGIVTDACTNQADTDVYAAFTYNDGVDDLTGTEAVSQVASDCVLGTAPNLAPNTGCPEWVAIIIMANTPENRQGAADCVEECMVANGINLTADCSGCYGESVSGGAGFCLSECAADPEAQVCIDCRCGANAAMVNLIERFEVCSGLTSADECL